MKKWIRRLIKEITIEVVRNEIKRMRTKKTSFKKKEGAKGA